MSERAKSGRLAVVGSGLQLGRDISQRALSTIRHADRVFAAVDEFTLAWLQTERADVVSLARHYGEGKDRRQTYREMEQDLVAAVEEGHTVCAVFYGHPGVFADVPHAAIAKLRQRGYLASMEPGISAEACLYADLGLDPGASGVQSFEATQFLVYRRQVDPGAALILWQVGLTGDLSCREFSTSAERLRVLQDKLLRDYAPDTPVVLYEAAILPSLPPRIDHLPLSVLPQAALKEFTTLVILPTQSLQPDEWALNQLGMSPRDLTA